MILFLGIFAFRLLTSLLIRTFFEPDEYWQSLEVAHLLVFGYGKITWEWVYEIRSIVFPLIFAIPYQLIKSFSIEDSFMFLSAPKVLQSIIAASIDYVTFLIGKKLGGSSVAKYCLLFSLTNWFNLVYYPRTFSNVLETLIVLTIQLASLKLDKNSQYFWITFAMFISSAIRPTILVFFVPHLIKWFFDSQQKLRFVLHALLSFGLAVLIQILIDYCYYGHFTFVLYNFIEFNFISGLSKFYGTHPVHWYLSEAIPAMLNLQLLPFLLYLTSNVDLFCLLICIWPIFVFSLLGHKEMRFILPILPTLSIFAAKGMPKIPLKARKIFLVILVAVNVSFGIYMGLFHQSGTISAMHHLRSTITPQSMILNLMPCHSAPLYSIIHMDIPIIELSCNPPLPGLDNSHDQNEFFNDPCKEVAKYISSHSPSHFILFECLEKEILDILQQEMYEKCFEAFHAHLILDSQRDGRVLIYCRKK